MTPKEAAIELRLELSPVMESCEEFGADRKAPLCKRELINSLQEKYDLFGRYHSLILQSFDEIEKDSAKRLWLDHASEAYYRFSHDDAKEIPILPLDGSLANDFFALFVMLPSTDNCYDEYRRRGFSHDEALIFLGNIKMDIELLEKVMFGRPAITKSYFRWLTHYLKCTIFDHGGLNFEIRKAPAGAYMIRSRRNGETVILSNREKVHRDGMPLGSAGYTDEEGSYSALFRETDSHFIGHPIEHYRLTKKEIAFDKTEWEIFLRPGDDVIGIHIPRGTDLSPEKIKKAYYDAIEITKKAYPERDPKIIACSSWLMDPILHEMLGDKSRISAFSKCYKRFPNKSEGREIYSFVFPNFKGSVEELPENSSLQRKIKARYLEGKYLYAYTGFLLFEDIKKIGKE